MTAKQQQLVKTLEVVRVEDFLFPADGLPGRPAEDRTALTRAFVGKVVWNMPTTRVLIDRRDRISSSEITLKPFTPGISCNTIESPQHET